METRGYYYQRCFAWLWAMPVFRSPDINTLKKRLCWKCGVLGLSIRHLDERVRFWGLC